MGLSEPGASDSHVAPATGAVPFFSFPPPYCSSPSPFSDLLASSTANPSSFPLPSSSSAPTSDPPPPSSDLPPPPCQNSLLAVDLPPPPTKTSALPSSVAVPPPDLNRPFGFVPPAAALTSSAPLLRLPTPHGASSSSAPTSSSAAAGGPSPAPAVSISPTSSSVPPPLVPHNPRSASPNSNSSAASPHSSAAGPNSSAAGPFLGPFAPSSSTNSPDQPPYDSNPAPVIPGLACHHPLPTPSSQPRPLPSGRHSGAALSYAQAARGPRGSGFVRSHAADVESFARLPRSGINIVCGSREGAPSFSFVASDLPKVEALYSNALVMRFHGGRPSLEASHKEILSWGIEQPFSIGPLSSRAFLLRFQDHKDLVRVLSRPSSILITFPYKVFRWHNQCHIKEDSCFAPVWVSLPKLPLQCFIPEFLEAVANKIGRFLCFDKATATLARPSAARMCVELDLRNNPPPFIWVGLFEGFKQPIIYERMPKFCPNCVSQGHVASACPWGHRETLPIQSQLRTDSAPGRPSTARRNATARSSSYIQPTPTPASSNTPHPPYIHNLKAPISQSNPPPPTKPPQQIVEPQPTAHSPDPHASASLPPAPNNNHKPSPTQSKTPNKSPAGRSSIRRSAKKIRKKVSFDMGPILTQSNAEANSVFWEAVKRQVSILEQQRTQESTSYHHHQSSRSSTTPNPSAHNTSSSNTKSPAVSPSTSDSDSSLAAESPPLSPRSNPRASRDGEESVIPSSYLSEGEEPVAKESLFQGHASDGMLSTKPKSSKRNKRHPDQPLKVQLRVRKDQNPTS